ncbi:MAG: BTAD domain-containing putative transcriptional regulator [Chloroflexota bacterium]
MNLFLTKPTGSSSTLDFRLLGPPTIHLNSRPLPAIRARKARALLYYLAVETGMHSRDELVGLLWSELPETRARNNLRTVLSELRQVVGEHLTITPQEVGLPPENPSWVDVNQLCSEAYGNHVEQELAYWDELLALYRGEFLKGFHIRNAPLFEEWVLAQREQLRLRVLDGLKRLIALCIDQGKYDIGLHACRRLLALEPWLESAHCQAMILLATSGQRTEALAQYQRCCQVLANELDIEPGQETVALYEQIKSRAFESSPPTAGGYLKGMLPIKTAIDARKAVETDEEADTLGLAAPVPAPAPAFRSNLPSSLTALIGRENELAYILAQLQNADSRLISVIGLGGMGKTHLAEEAARHILTSPEGSQIFPDGLFWVSLVDIIADGAMGSRNAIALAILNAIGISLAGNSSISEQLLAYLTGKRCLIILDNFEHLIEDAPLVGELLRLVPGLTILTTSREPLNVEGEWCLPLEGLALPQSEDGQWSQAEASLLFVQQARQHDARFAPSATDAEAIARICHLVVGLPLAIKLAAQWLRFMDCAAIGHEIATGLDKLSSRRRDAPARHRTMHAVFDASWRMLAMEEQQALMRLSIFRGPILEEAALQVAQTSLTMLRQLVERSFVRIDENRLYSIHELLRQFLAERRRQDPEFDAETQLAFCAFYVQWVKAQVPRLTEVNAGAVVKLVRQQQHNVRHAWSIALNRRNTSIIEQTWKEVKEFHDFYAYYQDGFGLFEDAIVRLQDVASPLLLGYLHMAKATYDERFWRSADAFAALEKSISLFDSQGDLEAPMAEGYRLFGSYLVQASRFTEAEEQFERALRLSRQFEDEHCESHTLRWMASSLGNQGDHGASYRYAQEALAVSQTLADRFPEIFCWLELGACQAREGKHDRKIEFLQKALDISRSVSHRPSVQRTHIQLGEAYIRVGVFDQALAHIEIAHQIALEDQMFSDRLRCQAALAHVHSLQEDHMRARHVIQQVIEQLAGRDFTSSRHPIFITLGRAQFGLNEWGAATNAYRCELQQRKRAEQEHFVVESLAGLAEVALAQGEVSTAQSNVETILPLLSPALLDRASDPLRIYLSCHQVLNQIGDLRAVTVLTEGHRYLQTTAALLEDGEMRQSYLENVLSNRKMVGLWASHENKDPTKQPAIS